MNDERSVALEELIKCASEREASLMKWVVTVMHKLLVERVIGTTLLEIAPK